MKGTYNVRPCAPGWIPISLAIHEIPPAPPAEITYVVTDATLADHLGLDGTGIDGRGQIPGAAHPGALLPSPARAGFPLGGAVGVAGGACAAAVEPPPRAPRDHRRHPGAARRRFRRHDRPRHGAAHAAVHPPVPARRTGRWAVR